MMRTFCTLIAPLRKQFYANTPLPAATWVQVQRLYTPANVLEVELVAEYQQ